MRFKDWLHNQGRMTKEDRQFILKQYGTIPPNVSEIIKEVKSLEDTIIAKMTPAERRVIQSIEDGRPVSPQDMPTNPSETFLQVMHMFTEQIADDENE